MSTFKSVVRTFFPFTVTGYYLSDGSDIEVCYEEMYFRLKSLCIVGNLEEIDFIIRYDRFKSIHPEEIIGKNNFAFNIDAINDDSVPVLSDTIDGGNGCYIFIKKSFYDRVMSYESLLYEATHSDSVRSTQVSGRQEAIRETVIDRHHFVFNISECMSKHAIEGFNQSKLLLRINNVGSFIDIPVLQVIYSGPNKKEIRTIFVMLSDMEAVTGFTFQVTNIGQDVYTYHSSSDFLMQISRLIGYLSALDIDSTSAVPKIVISALSSGTYSLVDVEPVSSLRKDVCILTGCLTDKTINRLNKTECVIDVNKCIRYGDIDTALMLPSSCLFSVTTSNYKNGFSMKTYVYRYNEYVRGDLVIDIFGEILPGMDPLVFNDLLIPLGHLVMCLDKIKNRNFLTNAILNSDYGMYLLKRKGSMF